MIPEGKVREVAERISIVDVIGEYLPLRRSGSNFVGLCPFHGEKTPSFNVNPAREIFHCFGCGTGGDVFSFLMKIEGLTFPEAVRRLAGKAGVYIEERALSPKEQRAESLKAEQQKIMALATRHYRELLVGSNEGAAVRNYLQNRCITPEISETYGLGAAFGRRDALVKQLGKNNCSLEVAAELGLVRRGDYGWYDLLHNRLIFPIRDNKGNTIAFAGRVLDDGLPKYLNTPESPLYHKSSVLFGLDLALLDIRRERAAIVVEGYFDHLALYKAGVRNVLATCGTALTEGHIRLLRKHAEQLYLLFDSDKAGRVATVRAMELCLEHNLPAYVISLPGDDPDSFMQQNSAEDFAAQLKLARPAFEQFMHWLLAKTSPDSVDRKVRLMDEIIPRFKRISDPVERNLYEKEICRLLEVDLPAFRKRVAAEAKGATRNRDFAAQGDRQQTVNPLKNKTAPNDPIQETLLGILLHYPESRTEMQVVGLEKLFNSDYLPLAGKIAALDTADSTPASLKLSDITTDWQKELAARLLVTDEHLTDINWRVALQQCVQRIKQNATRELKQLSVKLADLVQDSPEYHELLIKADELRNRKSTLQ